MMRFVPSRLRHFLSDEDGSQVVPFALIAPVFIGLIIASIEVGVVTIRHTVLERSLDSTVRDLRLGTGTNYTSAGLKSAICNTAAILPNCEERLHLEMVSLDMRDWQEPIQTADCVDTSLDITPNRSFEYGESNEMMLIRACFKFQPITPAGSLSANLATDDQGYSALVSYSAFVHEPI